MCIRDSLSKFAHTFDRRFRATVTSEALSESDGDLEVASILLEVAERSLGYVPRPPPFPGGASSAQSRSGGTN
eukprot:13796874-Alexandrium_andersonii.AAC.1